MTCPTRISLAVVSFMLFCLKSEAQKADSAGNLVENGWIEKMSDKVAFDLSVNNSYRTYEVETASNKILLYPNTPNNLRLKVNYKFISLGIQFAPDFLPGNGDDDLKGTTKSLQLGALLVFKRWFSDISYSKIKGYYLKNTIDYDNNWTSRDPFTQFPDLNNEGISISAGYIHNPKFSFRSLTTQTERQLKSAGSFVPVLNIDYYVINDKSSAVNTQKSDNIEFSIGPGYAHTFVIKEQFYASMGIFGSIGYLNTKLTTRIVSADVKTNQDNLILRGDGKVGIGYNGSKFYTGLFASMAGTQFQQENTTAMNTETRIFYHLFFGMRFNAPKFLKGNKG
jgi:hypothetical protein